MEWLKTILENATDEDGKVDVEAVNSAVKKELPKHFVAKADFNAKVKELGTANDTIKTLQEANKDNDSLQNTIKEHEATIAKLQKEKADTDKKYAVVTALKDKGCADADYVIYKAGGLDKFEMDEKGTFTNLDAVIKPLQESKLLFPTGGKKHHYDPNGGSGHGDINPFAKETYNLTEQGKLFRENPDRARELASQAGITL